MGCCFFSHTSKSPTARRIFSFHCCPLCVVCKSVQNAGTFRSTRGSGGGGLLLVFIFPQSSLCQFFLMQKGFLTENHFFICPTRFNLGLSRAASFAFRRFGDLIGIYKCLHSFGFRLARLCSNHFFCSTFVFHTIKSLTVSSLTCGKNVVLGIGVDALAFGSGFDNTTHFIGLSINDVIHELLAYATSVVGCTHSSSHRLEFFDGHC